jgi:hypothetical protein
MERHSSIGFLTYQSLASELSHENTHRHHGHYDSMRDPSDRGGLSLDRISPLRTKILHTKSRSLDLGMSQPREGGQKSVLAHAGQWDRTILVRKLCALT